MAIEYFPDSHYEYEPLAGPNEPLKDKNGKAIGGKAGPDGRIRLLTIEKPSDQPKKKKVAPPPKRSRISNHMRVRNVRIPKSIKPNPRNPKESVPGQLMCRMKDYDKDKAPPYEALSWVWGDNRAPKSKSVRIWTNDRVPLAKEIKITEQLEVALKALRDKNKSRVIWVDALCFNQRDAKEREREMVTMYLIYRNATQVTIWLGKAADNSDFVPAFIKKILSNNLEGVEELVKGVDNVKKWGGLSSLMRRQWFTRRWCVQEVACAKKAVLQFGTRSKIPWQDFADAVRLVEDWREDIERLLVRHDAQRSEAKMWDHIDIAAPGAQGLVALLNEFFRKESGDLQRLASIETVLCSLSSYDVTVPKDAVYALLQLGKDTWTMRKGEDVQPNYELSTLEVYKEFVQKISIPWAPYPRDDELQYILPSWIVPLSRRAYDRPPDDPAGGFSRINADCLVGNMGKKPYNASGSVMRLHPPMVEKESENQKNRRRFNTLTVKGRVIGVVSELGERAKDGHMPFSWLDMAIASMKKKAQQASIKFENPDADEEEDGALAGSSEVVPKKRGAGGIYIPGAFWRTLVADRGPNGTGPPGWYRRLCQKYFTRPGTLGKTGFSTDKEIHLAMINSRGRMNGSAVEFLRRVQAATWNKKFMITVGGKFGLVPEESKRRDSLCLIYGCSVPVVMRPTPNGNHWLLVGECYIYGIMNGELLEKDPKMRMQADSPPRANESAPPKIGNTVLKII